MKRTIFLRFLTTLLISIYIALVVYSAFFDFFELYKYWFSLFLVVIGISLFARHVCFKVDSNLFSGVLLISMGLWGILCFYLYFPVLTRVAGYIGCFAGAFLSVFIKFRQIFQLKVFVFIFLYVILLIVYSNALIPLWLFITLLASVSVVVGILVISSMISNMRKV